MSWNKQSSSGIVSSVVPPYVCVSFWCNSGSSCVNSLSSPTVSPFWITARRVPSMYKGRQKSVAVRSASRYISKGCSMKGVRNFLCANQVFVVNFTRVWLAVCAYVDFTSYLWRHFFALNISTDPDGPPIAGKRSSYRWLSFSCLLRGRFTKGTHADIFVCIPMLQPCP